MPADPKQRRAARQALPLAAGANPAARKAPITVERITDAALDIVATQGYDALTMRSVAARLETGPASLYAHVVNKADLNELIIGRLCAELNLPIPDRDAWREQILDVCTQLRDQYLKYPGVSRAAMAMGATDLDVLRVAEAMLAILIEGGVQPQSAAWAIDALNLYVGAYTLELSLTERRQGERDDDWAVGRAEADELAQRFEALPADRFPQTKRYATELTAGTEHERFEFTLGLLVGNLPRA
jgi:AcrR family transcriptional regulator